MSLSARTSLSKVRFDGVLRTRASLRGRRTALMTSCCQSRLRLRVGLTWPQRAAQTPSWRLQRHQTTSGLPKSSGEDYFGDLGGLLVGTPLVSSFPGLEPGCVFGGVLGFGVLGFGSLMCRHEDRPAMRWLQPQAPHSRRRTMPTASGASWRCCRSSPRCMQHALGRSDPGRGHTRPWHS